VSKVRNKNIAVVFMSERAILKLMTHREKLSVCLAASIGICVGANAVPPDPTAGGPYHGIVERNVFGLHDPPPPPPPPDPQANKPPPPPLLLTGVSTIFGKAKALFKVSLPAKPGEPARDSFPIIPEGGTEDNIEVLHIDVAAGIVRAKYYGVETNLDFKNNGPKVASAPPAAAVPGMPPPAGGMQPPPAFNAPSPGLRTIPSRSLRLPGGAPAGMTAPGTDGGVSATNPQGYGAGGTPGNYYAGQPQQPQQQAPQQPQLTHDEAAFVIEAERERLKQSGDGLANLMPITHFTPAGAPGTLPSENADPNSGGQNSPNGPATPTPPGSPFARRPGSF
jgi:hypothetical protein